MKKIVYFMLALLLWSAAGANAQVTIGSLENPQPGTLLDLNSDVRGGLLLSNVFITHLDSIPADTDCFPGITKGSAESDVNRPLTGMVVYNTNPATGTGIHVWDGEDWKKLSGGGSITIESDPNNREPFDADGSCENKYAVSDPSCSENGVFSFTWIAGEEYIAMLAVTNPASGEFTVRFQPNDRASSRNAILLVTSPCGGSNTFVFTQEGDVSGCNNAATAPKILAENNTTGLCSGGAVYLYLQGRPAGTYIWTLNGSQIGTGTHLAATQAGRYIVYANKIGCTVYKPDTLQVSLSSTGAPEAPSVIVGQNNGFVCTAVETAWLFAYTSGTGTLVWYKNGVKQAGPGLTGTTIAAGIGEWFAVTEDGSCSSTPSNTISVQLDPNAGNSGINTFSFTINGITAGSAVSLCSGGTLNLAVVEPHQEGVTYTWYNNNTVIGVGGEITYALGGFTGNFVLRCRATKTGACSKEQLTQAAVTAGQSPGQPFVSVNTGGALCGGYATLTAEVTGTVDSYIWYRSESGLNGTYAIYSSGNAPALITTQTGYYRVATVKGSCVSPFSQAKQISQASAAASVTISGLQTGNIGATITFTATMDNPQGASYEWTASGLAQIQGSNTGSSVVVYFPAANNYTINLIASNACGAATVKNNNYPVTINPACTPANITQHQPETLTVGLVQGKSSTLNITPAGSQTLSCQWYKPATAVNSGETQVIGAGNSYSLPTDLAVGTHYYYCVVTSSCDGSMATSGVFTVTVSANPVTLPVGDPGVGSFSGRTCFDIAEVYSSLDCGDLASRQVQKADFSSPETAEQTYTFTAKVTNIKNVRFVVVDNEGCVESTSDLNPRPGSLAYGSSASLTVNYKTTLNGDEFEPIIRGRDRQEAAKVTIYVVYAHNNEDVAVPLNVTIQDCACDCPAKISSTQWLTFQCHNLGGEDIYPNMTIERKHHGDWYRFGASTASMKNTEAHDTNNAWDNDYYQTSGDWSTDNNPCSSGYRLPTREEWEKVLNTANNSQTNVGTFNSAVTNFSAGKKVGDLLVLPAAGFRWGSNGLIVERGVIGYYRTPQTAGDTGAYSAIVRELAPTVYAGSRNNGYSVRCVSE